MTSLNPSSPLKADQAEGSVDQKAVGVGSIVATSGAVVACAACCVVPLALPIVALAGFGGVLAWLSGAHVWITAVAVMIVVAAWAWLGWRTFSRRLRPARSTLIMMMIATGLLALALLWPRIEPALLQALR